MGVPPPQLDAATGWMTAALETLGRRQRRLNGLQSFIYTLSLRRERKTAQPEAEDDVESLLRTTSTGFAGSFRLLPPLSGRSQSAAAGVNP